MKIEIKQYLRLSLLTSLILLITFYGLLIQKVNATPSDPNSEFIYKIAWKVLSDKFYLKDNFDFNNWENKFDGKIKNGRSFKNRY